MLTRSFSDQSFGRSGPAGRLRGAIFPIFGIFPISRFALFSHFRPRGGPEGTLSIAPNDCDMSAKPLNALNSGTVGVVLGMYMGKVGIYRALRPPPGTPKIPQKKNPQKIHLLEVPYQVIFPPFFGPRGPGGPCGAFFAVAFRWGVSFIMSFTLSHLLFTKTTSLTTHDSFLFVHFESPSELVSSIVILGF